MKKIQWSLHARERLVEREIDKKLVETAIKESDQIITIGKQKIFHKRYYNANNKEYLLRIFTEEHINKIYIRSVYRTSKINKYWRYKI
jgi:hypothetical protein